VFIGVSVCLANDRSPLTNKSCETMKTNLDWHAQAIVVRKGVSLGEEVNWIAPLTSRGGR
jgi:hypothetical protein